MKKDPITRAVGVIYTEPQPVLLANIGGWEVTLEMRFSPPILAFPPKYVTMKQEAFITIRPDKEKHAWDFDRMAGLIGRFFSLAVKEPVYPEIIECEVAQSEDVGGQHPFIVRWCYQIEDFDRRAYVPPLGMLFSMADTEGRFTDMLTNWLSKAEILAPVYSTYFGPLYNDRLFNEFRFLSLIQALETYHRRTINNFSLSSEEFKKRTTAVLAGTPEEYKKWIKQKLAFANEPSLHDRLKDILGVLGPLPMKFIPNQDAFCQRVRDTRNYYTHYGEKLKAKAATRDELWWITQRLVMLADLCLLRELGFSHDEMGALIDRNGRYAFDIMQNDRFLN